MSCEENTELQRGCGTPSLVGETTERERLSNWLSLEWVTKHAVELRNHSPNKTREKKQTRRRPPRNTKVSSAELKKYLEKEKKSSRSQSSYLTFSVKRIPVRKTTQNKSSSYRGIGRKSLGNWTPVDGINIGLKFCSWCVNMSSVRIQRLRRKNASSGFCVTLSKDYAGQFFESREFRFLHIQKAVVTSLSSSFRVWKMCKNRPCMRWKNRCACLKKRCHWRQQSAKLMQKGKKKIVMDSLASEKTVRIGI